LRVFNKKTILVIFLVLLFFTAIIALTKEVEEVLPVVIPDEMEDLKDKDFQRNKDDWLRPARWFRSNSSGMALEEIGSRFSALRKQYALAINYVSDEEIPEYLSLFFNENYYTEVRILYKKGEQIRTQWIFRDEKGNTRLNSVVFEPEPELEPKEKNAATQKVTQLTAEEDAEIAAEEDEEEHGYIEEKIVITKDIKNRKGFIEIFDKNYFLTSEYRYFEDGRTEKTEYTLKDNVLITAEYFVSVKNNNFKPAYTDYYRYNRSFSLRNIERIFKDEMSLTPAKASFPRRIMDSLKTGINISERINLYPDFFGDISVGAGYKMDFNIDDKGRVLGQTLYNEENKLVWTIQNTWKDNRIVSTTKTEGETVLTAEYVYNKAGDMISEKNIKNGVLERVVLIEGKTEIEELYMNNAVVLRAVWEDGRKISETRVRN
jgi:hypothetical protein